MGNYPRYSITTTPVVVKFLYSLPVIVETDASQTDAGAALYQPRMTANGTSVLHPVAYFSKRFTPTQQRYGAQERELLAIVWAMQHWRYWLEGGDVTVLADHDSLKLLRTKQEQPPRIQRFLDILEHFNVRIVTRSGKTNVMADWLSRPASFPADESELPDIPEEADGQVHIQNQLSTDPPSPPQIDRPNSPQEHTNLPQAEKVKHVDQLNRVDLQAIFEFLELGTELPPGLSEQWVRRNFKSHENALFRLQRVYSSAPNSDNKSESLLMLKIPEYEDLVNLSAQIHQRLGHASIGTTIRELSAEYWHPELILASHEAVRTCKNCQLMQRPDPTLGYFQPITPAPPLTRWGIDFTGPLFGLNLLNAIEYTTGWLSSAWTTGLSFQDTIPLTDRMKYQFGSPKELISDNALCFQSKESLEHHGKNGTKVHRTTPYRPRANGKVEQANGKIKAIIIKLVMDQPGLPMQEYLDRAVYIYNRIKGPSGYSPYFLLYGTKPPDEQQVNYYSPYQREPTPQEETLWTEEYVRMHEVSDVRAKMTSLKAARDKTRAYLQENKSLMRTYASGDWVLRVRQRTKKTEPFYDGPYAIHRCFPNNVYSLLSPGGIELVRRYNATQLFPAYTRDGNPVRSLWYGSQLLLRQDRRRIAEAVGLEV